VAETDKKKLPEHYVQIDRVRCNGCVLCMKICPKKAIRVEGGRMAKITGVCIDCGECIRVCPRGAIRAHTTEGVDIDRSSIILSVSPVLYTQFGPDVSPGEIVAALKQMGFLAVYDECDAYVLFNLAVAQYLRETRGNPEVPRPLFSSICPVVMRLIADRFPSLLGNITPIIPPSELVARHAKDMASKLSRDMKKKIRIYQITPCSAKMMSLYKSLVVGTSALDGVIGISTVYHEIVKHLQEGGKAVKLSRHSGIGWCMSGGEIAGMAQGNYLAVSGMQETILYLEKIEMGLLRDIEYVEFRTCSEGCIGGPLTVCDKYQAKYTIQQSMRMHGHRQAIKHQVKDINKHFIKTFEPERNIASKYMKQIFRKRVYFTDQKPWPPVRKNEGVSFSEAIKREKHVEEVYKILPGKECGACGSPDCRTFAEDVADHKANLHACVFLPAGRTKGGGK